MNISYLLENTGLVNNTTPLLSHVLTALLILTMNKRSLSASPTPQPDELPPKHPRENDPLVVLTLPPTEISHDVLPQLYVGIFSIVFKGPYTL